MNITYTVHYEKEVDGEYDNFTKTFTNKERALAFATEKYASVEYEKDEKEFGYVNVITGELMPYRK